MNIDNWFSTPILYHRITGEHLELVQKEIAESIPNVTEKGLTNPWDDNVQTSFKYGQNQNNYLTEYNCITLNDIVLSLSKQFLKQYNAASVEKYKIISSWINFSHKNEFQFDHSHTERIDYEPDDVILSGVYYFQTNGNDGDIMFSSPNILQLSSLDIFSQGYVNYTPEVGKLLLFPAWLQHRVGLNKTDNVRVSITFNVGLQKKYI